MSMRNVSLVITVLLAVTAVPVGAQDKLGDLVAEVGYDWIVGNWSATGDDGGQIELEYKWILDENALCVNMKMGDFKYHGMIMFVPSSEEVIQLGADNMGGKWDGTWGDDYDGAVNRHKRLDADGSTQTMEHVYVKVDDNSFKVKQYGVDSDGWRASEPRGELTFKRQKVKVMQKAKKGSELDGTWVGTTDGEYWGQWTFVISKGKVEIKGPDSMFFSGTIKLNNETNPKQADFKINNCSQPDYIGATSLSIYKLEGDKLTLVSSEPGSMYRPAYFESSGGAMVFPLTRK